MNDDEILLPGSGVLYMKVGTHADEPLKEIVERKRREIDRAGYALWGYGGNTCHPTTMVQPFARDYEVRGQTIHLVMQSMQSNHFAVTARAEEMSSDGVSWQPIPAPLAVVGSRYALAIKDLHETQLELPLGHTRVAAGLKRGRRGDMYIRGRVDKAVLEIVEDDLDLAEADEATVKQIGLVAEIVAPYAVFVRN
jgi:hypothetical protein